MTDMFEYVTKRNKLHVLLPSCNKLNSNSRTCALLGIYQAATGWKSQGVG